MKTPAEQNRLITIVALVLFAVIIYFPLFLRLDTLHIQSWDESLFALRAYKLANTGDYLYNFNEFDTGSDHINGKPPFATYIQALSFKLLGYNELALRLPIALFALATVWLIVYFLYKEYNTWWPGLLAGMVLITSAGFIHLHASRTGDQDVVVAFFVVSATICLYRYVQTDKSGYWWLFMACIVAGFLTKSVGVLLCAPGWLVYVLYKKKLTTLLKRPVVYAAILAGVGIIVAQYAVIQSAYPDYLKHVWEHETGGRYGHTIHGHRQPAMFFIQGLIKWQFAPWIFFAILGVVAGRVREYSRHWDLGLLIFLSALSHLLVISGSATKLEWYAIPLIPLLAIPAGMGIWFVYQNISRHVTNKMAVGMALLLSLLFLPGYLRILDYVHQRNVSFEDEEIACFMKQMKKRAPDLKKYTFLDTKTQNFVFAFYQNVWNDHEGYQVDYASQINQLEPGQVIFVCRWQIWVKVKEQFEFEVLDNNNTCEAIRLGKRR